MQSPKGWLAGLIAVALGSFLLASPPQAGGADPTGHFAPSTGPYVHYPNHDLGSLRPDPVADPQSVPEPGTTTLLIMGIGSGLLALFTGVRRQR